MEARWRESLDTEDLVKRYIPSATESQVDKYLKQIGKIWEIFEVKSKDHTWIIVKSHNEIQQFIIKYNLKFKAKIVFGSFMMKCLRQICENSTALDWQPLLTFFEIEELEIKKVKCMTLLKKSGGRYKDYFCCRLPWQWNQRDFVIIKSGVLYYSVNREPKEYLPFGASFKIFKGKVDTGYQFGIRLQANHRKLLLHAERAIDFFQLIYYIQETQRQALIQSENRYNCFSPLRSGNNVELIVDGEDYFRAVAEGIERAQQQIMISGWYISPEFQLIRPVSLNKEKRLDTLLKRAVGRGLKIFILVYNESSFLNNDSAYVKQSFEAISPSIKVIQHPLGVLPTFWSHHQKMVIIDQTQAFVGGLDLGFARFDNSQHLINHNDEDFYPGIQYNNVRITDLTKVREFWIDGVSREKARLPWHDVAIHLVGESVMDLTHHFIEYWNYASFQTYYQDRYVLILKNEDKPRKPFLKKIGEDIANRFKNIKDFAGELKKKIFRSNEEATKSEGDKPTKQIKEDDLKIELKNDDFNQSNNGKFHRADGFKQHQNWNESTSPNIFKQESNKSSTESDKEIREGKHPRRRFNSVVELDEIVEEMEDSIEKIEFMNELRVTRKKGETLHEIQEEIEYEYHCQILRSVGSWSIGCEPNHRERSVHTAYLDLIHSSKRFIYIENQFFISSTIESASTVKNEIANEIYKRIALAILNKQDFKVWIILPLIPGFAGELDDAEAVIPRVIMYWQYNTINRGAGSLMARVADLGVDPSKYISFFGLRTHGIVSDKPHTQIVYLHSKLMIIDDEKAICGSANINERSMRGSRDSEVCILIEEGPQKVIKCKDGNHQVSEGIHNFRLKLFHQHFGNDLDATDPNNDQLYHIVKQRTSKNTALYRQIFRCYPDDHIKTLAQITILRGSKPNVQLYEQHKSEFKGFAVEFPLQFLKDENLLIGATLYPDSLSV